MRYGYYPGCSLERSAAPYAVSTHAVARALGLELEEIQDWNCCGATEYFALHRSAAYALVGRNLALAQAQLANGNGQKTLVAPCSACFLNLRKTAHSMAAHPELGREVNEALSAGALHFDPDALRVRHLLDVLVADIGLEAIRAKLKRPLAGLRVVPYYGCLLTRPVFAGPTTQEADGRTHASEAAADPEYPMLLDDLLAALGADVVDFPQKTHCCGGHMTQISADTAYSLIFRLLRSAAQYKADVIAVICPMCQLNLDGYQGQVNQAKGTRFELPVLYFTQLLGLALGLRPRDLGLGREIVSARTALAKVGVQVPAPATTGTTPVRRKKGDLSLPMPAGPRCARPGTRS